MNEAKYVLSCVNSILNYLQKKKLNIGIRILFFKVLIFVTDTRAIRF